MTGDHTDIVGAVRELQRERNELRDLLSDVVDALEDGNVPADLVAEIRRRI